MDTTGSRIKQRRIELGMSQDDLAKKIGFRSRSSIQKIEAGERNLLQSKIKLFADALGVTPAYIMGWEEEAEKLNALPVDEIDRLLLEEISKLPPEKKDLLYSFLQGLSASK